jgi:hypothetical protein
MWLRKRSGRKKCVCVWHMVRKTGGERSCDDCVNQERIFQLSCEKERRLFLTMRLRMDVWRNSLFQG